MDKGIRSIRKLPVNYTEDHRAIFASELEKVFDKPCVVKLNNVWFDSHLNVYVKDALIKSYLRSQTLINKNFLFELKCLFLNRFTLVTDPCLLITDSWSAGYFHWMLDCLPRLLLIDNYENYQIIIPVQLKKFRFVSESLQALGVSKVRLLETPMQYKFKTVLLPYQSQTTGNYIDSVIIKLRDKFISNQAFSEKPFRRLFISRARTTRRRIANENQVIDFLLNFGFEVIFCEDLGLVEQIKLFSEAKTLVANHGAGLTNMLFMRKGTNCLELRLNGDTQNNCYFSLASSLDINYYYQLCDSSSFSDNAHLSDVRVDIEQLGVTLSQIQNF